MHFSFSLSTSSLNIPKVQKQHLPPISPPRVPLARLGTSVRPLSVVCPTRLHRRSERVSKYAASSLSSSNVGGTSTTSRSCEEAIRQDPETYPQAIILDVPGMTSDGSAATVQRILENHPQVYVAIVNQTANSFTVWPVSEAKVAPNWQKRLGGELEKFLIRRGFKCKHRDIETLHGLLKKTPYSDWTAAPVSSLAPLDSELKSNEEEVEALKVEVKDLLLASKKELATSIEFINSLYRLGVSRYFEEEINEHLDQIFVRLHKLLEDKDYDLCTIANLFRVMRLHGYNITCDVFERFRGEDGEFKKNIAHDVKGILCLYEACFQAFPGENILDEALCFTRTHLQVLAENSSNPQLQRYIRDALMFPAQWNGDIVDALHYISYYEQDESANEVLLRFAKLSFNGLQLLYKRELAYLTRWLTDINIMEKFPYMRDRFAESQLWSVGCVYEPEYHFARMIYTKYSILILIMDDTFDTHGSFEQLQQLMTALERRTLDDGDELPKYMKNFYNILFEDLESNATRGYVDDLESNGTNRCPIFDDLGTIGTKRCSYKTTYLAEAMIELAKAYFMEAKWKNERKAPSFDDYIKNGKVTTAVEAMSAAIIVATENMGMKDILWLRSDPELLDAGQHVIRLANDIVGRRDSKERRDFPEGVACYMEQYGVPEDEAIEAITKIIHNKWKVMNQEMLKLKESNIPKVLLKFILNYPRITYFLNGPRDGYTYPAYIKEQVRSLLIDPLPM